MLISGQCLTFGFSVKVWFKFCVRWTYTSKQTEQPLSSPVCPQYPCWVLPACRHSSTTDVIKKTCLLHSRSWKSSTPFCSAQQILYQNLLRARWETLQIKGLRNGEQRHRWSLEIHREPMSTHIGYKRKPNFKDLWNLRQVFHRCHYLARNGLLMKPVL